MKKIMKARTKRGGGNLGWFGFRFMSTSRKTLIGDLLNTIVLQRWENMVGEVTEVSLER